MYTSNKIHIHNKCLCILEMIQTVNNRIENARAKLFAYEHSKWDSIIRIMHSREDLRNDYDRMQAVKERLVKYYENTFSKLNNKTAALTAA